MKYYWLLYTYVTITLCLISSASGVDKMTSSRIISYCSCLYHKPSEGSKFSKCLQVHCQISNINITVNKINI